MIGEVYKHLKLYFLFLPATALCLLLTNIFFIPFCVFTKVSHFYYLPSNVLALRSTRCFLDFFNQFQLRPNLKSIYFHLIPQLINAGLNVILILIWSGLINKGKVSLSEKGFDARSMSDAVLLVAVPTLFWSFAFTLVTHLISVLGFKELTHLCVYQCNCLLLAHVHKDPGYCGRKDVYSVQMET